MQVVRDVHSVLGIRSFQIIVLQGGQCAMMLGAGTWACRGVCKVRHCKPHGAAAMHETSRSISWPLAGIVGSIPWVAMTWFTTWLQVGPVCQPCVSRPCHAMLYQMLAVLCSHAMPCHIVPFLAMSSGHAKPPIYPLTLPCAAAGLQRPARGIPDCHIFHWLCPGRAAG